MSENPEWQVGDSILVSRRNLRRLYPELRSQLESAVLQRAKEINVVPNGKRTFGIKRLWGYGWVNEDGTPWKGDYPTDTPYIWDNVRTKKYRSAALSLIVYGHKLF